MSSNKPKLRDGKIQHNEPYSIGNIHEDVITTIGSQIVHRLAVGHTDITGEDFGNIFAKAISGVHREKPFGLADVLWNGCAWSVKTVKHTNPIEADKVRLISGRNSPDYSYGIKSPRDDIQKTGDAVLGIWNARIEKSLDSHNELRILVFIRDMNMLRFSIFESEAKRYVPSEYTWSENNRGNFEAKDKTGKHRFTWQPHGSQFTIVKEVPLSAKKFQLLNRPAVLFLEQVLNLVGYKDDWVKHL